MEWAHAIAPGANILLVEASSGSESDKLTAVSYAKSQPGVVVVSMSFYISKTTAPVEFSTETGDDSTFTTPAGHVGGNGLPGGVTFVASAGDTGAPPVYPATSPNVLAVGGTSLYLTSSNTWAAETGWTLGSDPGSYSVNGGGGGFSAYEPEPSYQAGVQATGLRTAPDVAYDGDPYTGLAIYDSFTYGATTPWVQNAGTSAGAPQWAALIAITDQGLAAAGIGSLDGPGQTLKQIYQLPGGDFHDITSGYNGYYAGTGYDLVTGRGSPIANLLVPDLVNSDTLSLKAATVNAVAGQPFQGTVATFSVADPAVLTGQFTATINWGDGQTSNGTIAFNSATQLFNIIGSHTYATGGAVSITVTAQDALGRTTVVGDSTTVQFPKPSLGSISPGQVAAGSSKPADPDRHRFGLLPAVGRQTGTQPRWRPRTSRPLRSPRRSPPPTSRWGATIQSQ